jgi:hypothetical protein
MEMLNALYSRLDALCASWKQRQQPQMQLQWPPTHGSLHPGGSQSQHQHQHQHQHHPPPVYKVQIIGDAYMVATGLLADDPAHAATACLFALACLREAAQVGWRSWRGFGGSR